MMRQDELPPILHYLYHRVRLSSGQDKEVDILASFNTMTWVCQSKWVTERKIGVNVLEVLQEQASQVEEEFGAFDIHMWIFAHEGLTQEAEQLAKEKGILWSDRAQLDGVLSYLGLRTLLLLEE